MIMTDTGKRNLITLMEQRFTDFPAAITYVKELIADERPLGTWLHPYSSNIACECSNCHIQLPVRDCFKFCPNCGTRMCKEIEVPAAGGQD